MANVRCCYVVVEPLRIVLNNHFPLTLALVLSFYEFFFNIVVTKGLHK